MGVRVEYETEISIFSFRELETNIFIFSIWKSAPIRALETFLPSNAAIIVTFSYGTLRAHFFRHPYNDFVGGSKEGFRLSTSVFVHSFNNNSQIKRKNEDVSFRFCARIHATRTRKLKTLHYEHVN